MIRLKIISILLFFVFYSFLSFAQERIILRPNGEKISLDKSKKLREAIKVSKLKTLKGNEIRHVFPPLDFTAIGQEDTLSYFEIDGFRTDFGFLSQDVMLQWFVTPADMTIKAAGFSCSDDEGAANDSVSLRLINLNWTEEQLKAFSSTAYPGYYPSDGDGFNNADFFGEEATGDWISKDINNPLPPWTDNADPVSNGWDYDLWNSYSFWPIVPEEQDGPWSYQWIEMMSEGFEPEVKAGDIFGVAVIHNGVTLDEDRIGIFADNTLGYPGWKYYENGRLSPEEPGWWVRMYTWDFAVAVDITGDEPPRITNVTKLPTSLTDEPRRIEATITDENPGGGNAGVATASLKYTVDSGDAQTVAMAAAGDL
ncbi:MAG: hypothetical protein KAQ90_01055, partial [Melioribacteraceae bacterium]|nr:hypothetical protein [Melioribacteraceae bacterium]